MSKEYLWVGKLDSSKKEVVFNPTEEGDEKLAAIGHSLLLKRAVLGPCSESDLNVVEMETTGYLEDEIKATLCCLQPSSGKKYDQCLLDTLIPHGETKFRLLQGCGPVTLFGQHIADFLGEDELLSGDEEDEELEEGNDELLIEDKKESKKRKNAKGGGFPKKMAKMDMEDEFEDDDEDFDDDDELDEEFTPGKAKKKSVTPAKKETNAKKATKATKKKN